MTTYWIIEKQPKFYKDSREIYISYEVLRSWNDYVVKNVIRLKVLRKL